eukprot:Clim_evm1s134 gene=Clim_evmTU1s134
MREALRKLSRSNTQRYGIFSSKGTHHKSLPVISPPTTEVDDDTNKTDDEDYRPETEVDNEDSSQETEVDDEESSPESKLKAEALSVPEGHVRSGSFGTRIELNEKNAAKMRKTLEEKKGYLELLRNANINGSREYAFADRPFNDDAKFQLSMLQLACCCGLNECVEMLVGTMGVNVNQRDPRFGRTALHYAVQAPESEILAEMNRLYFDVNPQGQMKCVVMLLDKGADVNAAGTSDGKTPLHLACARNHPHMIQTLLQSDADPSLRDATGHTPLDVTLEGSRDPGTQTGVSLASIAATKKKQETIVRLLLSAGASINLEEPQAMELLPSLPRSILRAVLCMDRKQLDVEDRERRRLIHRLLLVSAAPGVAKKQILSAEALAASHAPLRASLGALDSAASMSNAQACGTVSSAYSIPATASISSVANDHSSEADSPFTSPQMPMRPPRKSTIGDRALSKLRYNIDGVFNNHYCKPDPPIGVFDPLAAAGMDPDLLVPIAATPSGLYILSEILKLGVSVNCRDQYGRTPLMYAVANPLLTEAQALLLRFGANPTIQAACGGSLDPALAATDLADLRASTSVCEVRTAIEANPFLIDAVHYRHGSLLHSFARDGKDELVEVCLDAGADVGCPMPDTRHTPLHWAAEMGRDTIVGLLLEHGADATVKTTDRGWTPLHVACRWGRTGTVKRLLAEGVEAVDAFAQDRQGLTAWQIAATHRRKHVLQLQPPLPPPSASADWGSSGPEAPPTRRPRKNVPLAMDLKMAVRDGKSGAAVPSSVNMPPHSFSSTVVDHQSARPGVSMLSVSPESLVFARDDLHRTQPTASKGSDVSGSASLINGSGKGSMGNVNGEYGSSSSLKTDSC